MDDIVNVNDHLADACLIAFERSYVAENNLPRREYNVYSHYCRSDDNK